jgi:CRP-like cAMP-binding protein
MKIPGVFRNADTFREVPAGEVIFNAGDDGNEMYGVVEGQVEVLTPAGVSVRIGPDGTFGEMAVIDKYPRSATATAVVDTKLAVINQRMFLFLVHETPMFAIQVMSSLAERLRARG